MDIEFKNTKKAELVKNKSFNIVKMAKIATMLIILVSYVLLLMHKIDLPSGDDMARHIKNGELLLHGNFDVLYSNVYSYTETSHQFINHHWLSGVLFYLSFLAVGWSGLAIFKIIILVTSFAILFLATVRKSNFWLAALFSLPTLFILGGRTALRPEIFSYLFIAVFLYVLFEAERKQNADKILWLIPIELLWVNMHIFFPIGVALVGGFLIERIIVYRHSLKRDPLVKKLIFLFLGLIAVCFINPNGVAGVLYPLNIFANYGISVSENDSIFHFLQSYPLSENINIYAFFAALVLLGTSFLFNLKNKPIFYFLAALVTATLSFKAMRGMPLFALVFLPAVSANFYSTFQYIKNWAEKQSSAIHNLKHVFVSVLVILAISLGYFAVAKKFGPYYEFGVGLTETSNDAAQFLKQNKIKGPIFNDYDIGSYLILNLFPQEKVFVDNRPEAYSNSFFKDTYMPILENENRWMEELNKYNFNSIVFYRYDEGKNAIQFLYNRVTDPDWALVYVDQYAAVLVRNVEANREVMEKFKITQYNAEERFKRFLGSDNYGQMVAVSDNFDLVGRKDLGAKTLFQIVTRWPDSGRIWMVMGERRYLDDRSPQSNLLAVAYLERAIIEGYKTAETYSFLGAAYYKMGFAGKARESLEKSLRINPLREDSKALLNLINESKD